MYDNEKGCGTVERYEYATEPKPPSAEIIRPRRDEDDGLRRFATSLSATLP